MQRVLVVDDDRAIVRMVSLALRIHGFDVISAYDGQEALRRIDERRPDVIVLDLNMPTLDGDGVLRRLRARGIDIPVVVISGGAWCWDHRAHGADAFLPKPFQPDDLVETVASFAGGDSGETSAR